MNIVNTKITCNNCHWHGGPLETLNFTDPIFSTHNGEETILSWVIVFYCPLCGNIIQKMLQSDWEASIDMVLET